MAHRLGLEVVAEGVETAEQLSFLRDRACDSYQGYLLSKPVSANELTADLARLYQASLDKA
jgi:EAL domain-containing protein (putative c-di-GMP-specific phosphodiesterase class I)